MGLAHGEGVPRMAKTSSIPTLNSARMTDQIVEPPRPTDAPSACSGCAHLDRRGFLGSASMMTLGALLASCGDGVFDGPEALLTIVQDPIRVDPREHPELQSVGGRLVVTPPGNAPMLIETIGTRQYRVLSLVCPHRGSTVNRTTDGFLCPNHGARFSAEGRWLGGQATVDLSPVAFSIDPDGVLLVGGIVAPPSPPALALSQNTIAFSATVGGAAPAGQVVGITNTGGGTLSGITMAITYGAGQSSGWLAATLSSLSAPSLITLSVSRGTLGAGTYSATIRVSAQGISNAEQIITVTLVVIDSASAAAIQLSSVALSFNTTAGSSPSTQTVQVINSGAGSIAGLAFAVTYGAGATGWLSTSSLSATSTPSTLTVRPLTAGLTAGTYTATIAVSGTGVASRALTVTLVVAINGLAVTISAWPALASVGGIAGSVGTLNFSAVAVARTGANSFIAFSLLCPHAGSTVQVLSGPGGQAFRCPNHGATWNASGNLLPSSPQATSRLTPLTVTYTPGDTVLYVS